MSDFFNYFPLTSTESYFTPDFARKYARLVHGLDEESALTVSRCLNLLFRLQNADVDGAPHPALHDVFTEKEIARIIETEKKLQTGILQISGEAWAFGRYILPVNQFGYSTFIDKSGLDSVDLSAISPDAAIMDVGAYIGDSAVVFGKHLPDNKIYSFEPFAENFAIAKKTIALNGMENQVLLIKLALGDATATEHGKFEESVSRIDRNGSELLDVDTLDNFSGKNGIQKVGLIKCDIEGGEQRFLRGAEKTIRRDRPVMLLSIYHNPADYFGIKPWVEDLGLGYKFKIFKPMYRDVITETILVCIPAD
jgi:FkbM family methyltransferase